MVILSFGCIYSVETQCSMELSFHIEKCNILCKKVSSIYCVQDKGGHCEDIGKVIATDLVKQKKSYIFKVPRK